MSNKKNIANLIMVGIIALILLGGLIFTANHMGWFDKDTQTALAGASKGIIQLERGGIAYPLEKDMSLRDGDLLTVEKDAQITLFIGEGTLTLNEETSILIKTADTEKFHASVIKGEAFAFAPENTKFHLSTEDRDAELEHTTAFISVQTGSSALSVFSGKVLYAGEFITAGESLLSTAKMNTVSEFKADSLNDFCIAQAQIIAEKVDLCFSSAQLEKVVADREAAKQALIEEQAKLETSEPSESEEEETDQKPSSEKTENITEDPEENEEPEQAEDSEEKPEVKPEEKPEVKPELTPEPEPPAAKTCTISIRCDTILNNMDKLEPGKEAYVPGNGKILSTTTVEFSDGETVFDILQRVCSAAGISLEYSFTPAYNSYYIEGINNLYEFDCGSESGWMYEVNGWFPNYGCSSYTVSEGDSIVWRYTCVGLGADVGGGV